MFTPKSAYEGDEMITLTHNNTVNIGTKNEGLKYNFVPKDSSLMTAQNTFNFDSQVFEDLMAEGYLSMANVHGKYSEITFNAISEVAHTHE